MNNKYKNITGQPISIYFFVEETPHLGTGKTKQFIVIDKNEEIDVTMFGLKKIEDDKCIGSEQ